MTVLRQIAEAVARWLDAVATAFAGLPARLAPPRVVRLVERDADSFTVAIAAGDDLPDRLRIADGRIAEPVPAAIAAALVDSRIELQLDPSRFLFRPLPLPRQAAEFIGGIVRAQIDRITPWSADDAAFGWSDPANADAGRIVVTVAATARARIAPYVAALAAGGARAIVVSTTAAGDGSAPAPIRVLEQRTREAIDVRRVRRVLAAVLATMLVAAAVAWGGAAATSSDLDARQQALRQQISDLRASLRAARDGPADPATAARLALEKLKRESPLGVIVLETLSQVLPDHTYVTEMRIEGNQLRITGISQDAPSLIALMERAPLFTRATFFAPTTRALSDPGERFHIEARIEPLAAVPRS